MQNILEKSWPLATGGNFWQQNGGQDVVTLPLHLRCNGE
jgi:hypothetical protein